MYKYRGARQAGIGNGKHADIGAGHVGHVMHAGHACEANLCSMLEYMACAACMWGMCGMHACGACRHVGHVGHVGHACGACLYALVQDPALVVGGLVPVQGEGSWVVHRLPPPDDDPLRGDVHHERHDRYGQVVRRGIAHLVSTLIM